MFPKTLLPEDTRFCIAGGYAACPALAKDIDVWVYGVSEAELQERRAELISHLALNGYTLQTEDCLDVPQPQYEHTRTTLKVGVVTKGAGLPCGKPVHVMVTSAETIRDILDGFDVSTHAVAIGSNGYVVKHPEWTPPHEMPALMTSRNEKSIERMARIAARFGHKFMEVPVGETATC